VFTVHGVDENGKAALLKPKVSREQLPALIAQLTPCLIGMEARRRPNIELSSIREGIRKKCGDGVRRRVV